MIRAMLNDPASILKQVGVGPPRNLAKCAVRELFFAPAGVRLVAPQNVLGVLCQNVPCRSVASLAQIIRIPGLVTVWHSFTGHY